MAYVVIAGYVTVETAVPGGRARVDIPCGSALPDDVPREDVERCLAQGTVESIEPEEKPARKTASKAKA